MLIFDKYGGHFCCFRLIVNCCFVSAVTCSESSRGFLIHALAFCMSCRIGQDPWEKLICALWRQVLDMNRSILGQWLNCLGSDVKIMRWAGVENFFDVKLLGYFALMQFLFLVGLWVSGISAMICSELATVGHLHLVTPSLV